MGKIERDIVIGYIGNLSDEDLAALFYEAMKSRNKQRVLSDGEFWNHIYVIAIATHGTGEPAELAILASAHATSVALTDERKKVGPTESGKCESCGVMIDSTAKLALCPVCGELVECT